MAQKRATYEAQMKQIRLARALVEKERRLITKYFGGLTEMTEQIDEFLANYTGQTREVRDDE